MIGHAVFSLFLPLPEDLYPCMMLTLSSGTPRCQSGSPVLTVEFFLHLRSLKYLPSSSSLLVHLRGMHWGMHMEIPCSHRRDVPATVSQHFECPAGGV